MLSVVAYRISHNPTALISLSIFADVSWVESADLQKDLQLK